jgi:hypothetical protein
VFEADFYPTKSKAGNFLRNGFSTLAMPLSARHAGRRSRYTDAPPPAPTAASPCPLCQIIQAALGMG